MKTFEIIVKCPGLRRHRAYSIRGESADKAWKAAIKKFFAEFPRVLTEGLAVGC